MKTDLVSIIKEYYTLRDLVWPTSPEQAILFTLTELGEAAELLLENGQGYKRNNPKEPYSAERFAEELGDALMMVIVTGIVTRSFGVPVSDDGNILYRQKKFSIIYKTEIADALLILASGKLSSLTELIINGGFSRGASSAILHDAIGFIIVSGNKMGVDPVNALLDKMKRKTANFTQANHFLEMLEE